MSSALTLAMVSMTASKVRKTFEVVDGGSTWPDPLLLWPETFIAAVSGTSLSLSVRTAYTNSSHDSGSLRDPLCEKFVGI